MKLQNYVFIFLLLFFTGSSFAQYYQVSIVHANDTTQFLNLSYDISSTSYKDNSLANPDALLRVCSTSASDLQDKYISLAYADGSNTVGHYIEITHYPVKITAVPPNLCVNVPLEVSSFKAWYPSIPFVLISNTTSPDSAVRWKLSTARGWMAGNYSINYTAAGNSVNVTVTGATDQDGNPITTNLPFLVVGIVQDDLLTTTGTAIARPNQTVGLSLGTYTGNYTIMVNGIGGAEDAVPPYVKIYSPAHGSTYAFNQQIPFNFLITDDVGIASCWYVLDSATHSLPFCDISYVLPAMGPGLHTLTLYARDFAGNTGQDSVTFRVTGAGGGGGFGGGGFGGGAITTNVTNVTNVTPITPPSLEFVIIPEDIHMQNNYPHGAQSEFIIRSNVQLDNVSCSLSRGFQFSNISHIAISSQQAIPREKLNGTIFVEMTPEIALRSGGVHTGFLECVGMYNSTLWMSSSANVYFKVRKPELMLVDSVETVYPGVMLKSLATIINNGSAASARTSVIVKDPYKGWVYVENVPASIPAGGYGDFDYVIMVPEGTPIGTYDIPVEIYEYGYLVSTGMIRVHVTTRPPEIQPTLPFGIPCFWLPVAVLLAAIAGAWAYDRKLRMLKKGEHPLLPLLHGALAFLAVLAACSIAIWLLGLRLI